MTRLGRSGASQASGRGRVLPFPAALRLACAGACLALWTTTAEAARSSRDGATAPVVAPSGAEPTVRLEVLRNGSFLEHHAPLVDGRGARPLPWWRTPRGADHIVDGKLVLRPGERAEQPLALDPGMARTLRLRGKVEGPARLVVVDGDEGEVVLEPRGEFAIDGAELEARLGRPLVPRLLLRLESPGGAGAWSALAADAEFPCPAPEALAAEVRAELERIVFEWEERALDEFGPRRTRFVARAFDAETGAELQRLAACAPYIPFWKSSAVLAEHGGSERVRALHAAWWEDFLALGFAPATGLPAMWDPARDEPILDRPVEIALPLAHLVEVARDGAPDRRRAALERAARIAELVLERGLLPDGGVAASYRPGDGAPNLDTALLRRLDVPAQLARLAPLVERAAADGAPVSSKIDGRRLLRAAHEALAVLEYSHHWAGGWQAIDPGFDDEFGHYGARAALVARDVPGELPFRRFALEGLERYLEPWRGATALGGNLAADQVRCWQLAADLALAEPSILPRLRPALLDAAHAHMQGEQYGNGAFGDVTIYAFDPRTALQVGDLPGTPSNLVQGLATLAAPHLGLPQDEVRARYATVLRSTVARYRRAHGFLVDRAPKAGANPASGSLRLMIGLERMLVALSASTRR